MDLDPTETERSPSRFRRWAYLLTGIVIGGFFFYLAARNIDFNQAMNAIYAMDKAWVVPFTIVWLLNTLLRSLRWQSMFPDESRPSLRHAVDAFVLGKVGNNFMPGRLGEIVRASVIGKLYPRIGLTGTLATIMVEKILDMFAILAMLGLALYSAPLPAWITQAGMWLLVVFSLLLVMLWLISKASARDAFAFEVSETDGTRAKIVQFVLRLVNKFSSGLHTLRTARHFTLSSVLTLVIWAGETAMMFALIKAFSIPAPYMAAVVGTVFLCIGGMLPNAPGFVGTYQLFIVAAFQIFGVPETDAFALSLFMNFYVIILTSVAGVLVFMAEGGIVNIRQILATSDKKT